MQHTLGEPPGFSGIIGQPIATPVIADNRHKIPPFLLDLPPHIPLVPARDGHQVAQGDGVGLAPAEKIGNMYP